MLKKEDYRRWAEVVQPLQAQFTTALTPLVENLIRQRGIEYLSVIGRTKTLDSMLQKIDRKRYTDPSDEMTDISGLRVIAFLQSEVDQISTMINDEFEVDAANSLDKSKALGTDRIGYRSVHYVCKLSKARANLPEYCDYHGLKFEIQIRTVLQHAWAEMSHDRGYKFSGNLPDPIFRELNLYSGVLEVVDDGFQRLADKIDEYTNAVSREIQSGVLRAEINSITVRRYLALLVMGRGLHIEQSPEQFFSVILEELRDFGIRTLSDLDRLITDDFMQAVDTHYLTPSEIVFIRDAMMFSDINRYFERSWKKNWNICEDEAVALLRDKYGKEEVQSVFEKYGIDLL